MNILYGNAGKKLNKTLKAYFNNNSGRPVFSEAFKIGSV